MRGIRMIRLVAAIGLMSGLLGCLGAEPGEMPAEEAFALSASALSGSERYGLSGEVSVLDASGLVAHRLQYEGEVTDHDRLNVQWTNRNAKTTAEAADPSSSLYEPLGLLDAIRAKSATIKYRQFNKNTDEVQFEIKLNEEVAKRRIADQLRQELSALEQDRTLLSRKPEQSARTLAEAKEKLEEAIGSLKVTTTCEWTANRRTWFPSSLVENTELEYEWDGKTYTEKRASVTNFRPDSGDGTMNKQ